MKQAILLPREEQALRLRKLRAELANRGAEALLVTAPSNLFYTTGRVAAGYFYLPLDHDAQLFLCGEQAEDARTIRKPEQIPGLLAELGLPLPRRLALETGEISAAEYSRLAAVFAEAQLTDATSLLREARCIKTPYELAELEAAGRTHGALYGLIPALYEPGMSDLELCAAIEHEVRLAGSIGYFRTFGFRMEAFMGVVLSGANGAAASPYDFSLGGTGLSPAFPFGCCGQLLQKGETVLVDINFNPHGYMTDISRTFAVGQIDGKALLAHQTALDIERAVVAQMRPGASCAELYKLALAIAADSGLGRQFMGSVKQAAFIGHGLGIEINELPVLTGRSASVLQEGMVLALEPKFVTMAGPVGTENTYIITADGVRLITPCRDDLQILV